MTAPPRAADDLPAAMAGIVEDFAAVTERERLQLLLEFSDGLPDLPARYADDPALMEPVPECQSPVRLAVEVDGGGGGAATLDSLVHLHFSAPREAPTTRGFAGVLREGLDGLPARELLAVPDDVSARLGLERAVSPLRLRGMAGMLWRVKRQVRERTGA